MRVLFLSLVCIACCLPNHGPGAHLSRPEPILRQPLQTLITPAPVVPASVVQTVIPEYIPEKNKVLQDQYVSIQLPADYVIQYRDKPTDPPLSFIESERKFLGSISYERYDKGVLDYTIEYTRNMPMYAEKVQNAEKMRTTGYSYIDDVESIWMMTSDKESWFVNYFFVKNRLAYTLRCTAEYPDQVSYMVDQCQKLIAGLHAKGNDDFK